MNPTPSDKPAPPPPVTPSRRPAHAHAFTPSVTAATAELRTFQAKTMADALAKVKRELGPDAVILHTRSVTRGGVLGRGGRAIAEITAAPGGFSLPAANRNATVRSQPAGSREEQRVVSPAPKSVAATGGADPPAFTADVATLKAMIADILRQSRTNMMPSLPPRLRDAYEQLVRAQVAGDTATRLVERVRAEIGDEPGDSERVRTALAGYIEAMLPAAQPMNDEPTTRPRIIAIVGPTGVGKTTTIAKLAANHRLRDGLDVGLVTTDTHRIAAADQLRTYARIIDVPLEVAGDARQIRAAVDSMCHCHVILIDTAGSGPKDDERLAGLKEMLECVRPDEVHLALASTCSSAVLNATIDRFSGLGVNRLLFTKLDEAVGFGVILNSLNHAAVQLSYVTTGQEVPDDMEPGNPARLASLIVNDGSEPPLLGARRTGA